MALHLIRHAEAEAGEMTDPALSPDGVQQASRLARRLGDLGVERLVHGPARRARQTAEVLNSILGPLPMEESDAARDRTPFPDKGGQAYASHARTWLHSVPVQQRDPDGRALDGACTALQAMSDSRPMAVVTHAHVIAWFAGRVLGAPEDAWLRIAVDNASVTTLDRNRHGEVVLRRLNAS